MLVASHRELMLSCFLPTKQGVSVHSLKSSSQGVNVLILSTIPETHTLHRDGQADAGVDVTC